MVEDLSPESVKEKLDEDGDLQIVDIRSRQKYEQGHLPGAVNLPMTELPNRIDDLEWGDDVVVTCPIGESSVQAARLIESYEGVSDDADVRSMAGGYEAWDYELESGDSDVKADT